jgi:hypothetical protein
VASIQELSAGEHWWTALAHGGDSDSQDLSWTDTSSGLSSDVNAKGADQFALVIPAPSGQGASATTWLSDSSHSNSAEGSSSPDHPVAASETFDAQAVVYVNNELNAANKIATRVNLSGNLSVQDVISYGASDVFGSAPTPPIVAVASHSDGADSGQLVPTAITSVSSNSVVGPIASVSPSSPAPAYEPFNSAASEILDAFVRQNTFEVLTSNNHVVLFDTNASDFSSPDFIARTWSMSDGSTISIVGSVPHNLAVLA